MFFSSFCRYVKVVCLNIYGCIMIWPIRSPFKQTPINRAVGAMQKSNFFGIHTTYFLFKQVKWNLIIEKLFQCNFKTNRCLIIHTQKCTPLLFDSHSFPLAASSYNKCMQTLVLLNGSCVVSFTHFRFSCVYSVWFTLNSYKWVLCFYV